MTVNDLAGYHPALQFLCGQRGGSRTINYIDIVEIPGGAAWISPGNFVITTGYFIQSESDFEQLLRVLMENGSSGLGIKIGKHVKELPQSVFKLSEENHFPILSIPLDLRYRDIQNTLHVFEARAVPSPEPSRGNATDFFSQAILSPFNNRYQLQNLALTADIPFSAPRIVFVANATPEEAALSINALIDHPSPSFYLLYDENEQKLLGVFTAKPSMEAHDRLRFGQDLFYSYSKRDRPLAVSDVSSDGLSLRAAYQHACFALTLGSRMFPNEKLFRYVDFLDYDLIRQNQNNTTLQLLMWEYLQPVVDYDNARQAQLLPTLLALDGCNYNLQEACARLGIHRNTLYARVEKLRQVMKYDIDAPNTRHILHLALMHHALSRAGLLY